MWYLQEEDFKVFDCSFEILYDVRTFQKGVTTDFPQPYDNIAILSKTDDNHPTGFKRRLLLAMAKMRSILKVVMEL